MICCPSRRAAAALAAFCGMALPAIAAEAPPAGATVDLQMSLCGTPAQVERALALHPRGAPFDVWLFDTPGLDLFGKGLRIRLRDAKRGPELTLKVAEQDCAAAPAGQLAAGEGKCEYDLHGGKIAGALSLTRSLDTATAQALASGHQPLAGVLSPAQTRFLQSVPGAWPLPDALRRLGPTRVQSYMAQGKPYLVDVSRLPGGEHFIEISRKVPAADAPSLRDRLEADLTKAGVPVCADQSAQAVNKLRTLLGRP